MNANNAVAIVGAGCRLPGAPDLATFWRNLRAGTDTISRFGIGELLASGLPADLVRHPDYVPARGVLPGGELFDWTFFGYSLAEASMIDPQQRVFLEVCWAGLNDAGLDPARFPGWVGVFASGDVSATPLDPDDPEAMSRLVGAEKDFLATRVAYKLRLRGPAITVQTACSSSLVAVHQACQSLLGYECDAALAGGVSLWLPQASGYLYREGHILSADGRCRAFDAECSGTVPSNGAGVVVLRRYDDALADGDRIMGVLRGSGLNNDGGEKIGYTAPSLVGQRDVIRLALGQADVDPSDIAHVEAHGTATPIGDPVEVAALSAAFRQATDRLGYCWLGSVKSNIGHTGAAAGVVGLIKTALMLEHRELVPTVNFRRPNPKLELDRSPFRVITEGQPLVAERPALAAVSSFGIGGTNAHAVLEAPPAPTSGRGPAVFCLSAPSAGALHRARADLAELIMEAPADPVSIARTLATGRPALPHRVWVVAEDLPDAAVALRDEERCPAVSGPAAGGVAFLFPGQGALYPGAAAAAYDLLPTFREQFDEAHELARRTRGLDLSGALRADAAEAPLRESMAQQVGLFAIGYALGRQLLEWGVRPTAMLGHSAGEYVAAALSGVWDLATGLELVAERALAMRQAPPGRMLAVYASVAEVSSRLGEAGLAVATDGPGQTIVAGPAEAVERLHADLDGSQISASLLDADRQYHTERMRPATGSLRAAVARANSGTADLPVVSNLTGRLIEPERLRDPAYWADHMCSPVQLTAGMSALLASGGELVVELGPGQTMTGGLRRHPEWAEGHRAIALLGRAAEPRREALLAALGRLWAAGVPVDWDTLFDATVTRSSLPPVPLDSVPCPVPSRRPAFGAAQPVAEPKGVVVVGQDPAGGAAVAEDLATAGTRVTALLTANPSERRSADSVLAEMLTRPESRSTLSGRPELAAALREYAAGLVGQFVLDATRGGDSEPTTQAGLAERLDPDRRLPRMAAYLVSVLAEQGWLTRVGALTVVPDLDTQVRAALARRNELHEVAGLCRLLRHCAGRYLDVFAGRIPPVAVLYPDGAEKLLHDCLTDNLVAVSDSEPCLEALTRALRAWRAGRGREPVRVLEIGAGRGGLTGPLLDAWADQPTIIYHVTDVSRALVADLARKAPRRGATDVRATVFDITEDPVGQGLVPGSYDLIIGYNAVHVARSVPATLANLSRLMRADGALCLVEVTSTDRWTHLVWGLAPGWWDFDDGLRTASPHLDMPGWAKAFAAAGLDCAAASAADRADHGVLIAGLSAPERFRKPQAEIARQSTMVAAAAIPRRRPPAPGAPTLAGDPTSAPAGDALTQALAELWREALGVSSAAAEDDFYLLGGESLGMVQLLGRVRERTGVRVPVAEFGTVPTFGRLVERARTAHADSDHDASDQGADPPNLVRLHNQGDRVPLFLAAPGAGSALCYRQLAPLLGERQPVYGLDSPGLHDGAEPLTRIEAMAREDLRLVRQVQPRGPYLLGGWSIGAMIAHEMAAQLREQGERIAALLCIDGLVPWTGGRPVGVRPGYLARGLQYRTQTMLPFGRAANLRAALRLTGLAGPAPAEPVGRTGLAAADSRRITSLGPEFVRVYNANVRAMLGYVPRPVDCAAVVFKTGLSERARRRVLRHVNANYRDGVKVRAIPGDHWSVLDREHVGVLATLVRAVLDEVPQTP